MQTVKSVQLEQILDYLDPGVAFIKIDSEGKDCMVRYFPSSIQGRPRGGKVVITPPPPL